MRRRPGAWVIPCLLFSSVFALQASAGGVADPLRIRNSLSPMADWRPHHGRVSGTGGSGSLDGIRVEIAREPATGRLLGGYVEGDSPEDGLRLALVLDDERRLRRAAIVSAPPERSREIAAFSRDGILTRFTAMSLRQLRYVASRIGRTPGLEARVAQRLYALAVTLAAVLDGVSTRP